MLQSSVRIRLPYFTVTKTRSNIHNYQITLQSAPVWTGPNASNVCPQLNLNGRPPCIAHKRRAYALSRVNQSRARFTTY